MTHTTVGLLHPGAMGATLGGALDAGGARVVWCNAGRSEATKARAEAAGLRSVETQRDLAAQSDVIVSVCPPHCAQEVARAATSAGFAGVYVDANAISPASVREVQAIVEASGAGFVDGGIIGPPAKTRGTTRLYLSGERANEVAKLFDGTPMEARSVDHRIGSASALKMAYAAYTKGTTALLINVRALAAAEGVERALLEEWALSQAGLAERSEAAARNNAHKAWRFTGEMDEIADTFRAAGLPEDFHRGAAKLYAALQGFKDAEAPSLDEVLEALIGKSR